MRLRASSHESQNPLKPLQLGHRSTGIRRKRVLVMALRIEFVPLKETTMSLFVESVATKPVTSVKREL